LSIYMLCCGFWWSGITAFFFEHVFSCYQSRRCDDNQQITVSYFGEYKRLHLESSKQNYYIISLRAIIKAIFTSIDRDDRLGVRAPIHRSRTTPSQAHTAFIDWRFLLSLETGHMYPCLRVYVAQIHVDLSSRLTWSFTTPSSLVLVFV